MTTALTFRGDPVLFAAATAAPAPPTTLVWGVDLTPLARPRHAARALRAEARAILRAAQSEPQLRHLVIAYAVPQNERDRARHAAAAAARSVHAELERARGRYVDVVFVDITGHEDPEQLRARFAELSERSRGLVGYASLQWEDLREATIRDACATDWI